MNSSRKTQIRCLIYAVIAFLTPLSLGLKPGMTTLEIVQLVMTAIIAALIAVRAFIDQTTAREDAAKTEAQTP